MCWSLSLDVPEDTELLDLFFTAAGKSLYLANAFESKCSSLLQMMKLVEHYTLTKDAEASLALIQALSNTMLGASIAGLKDFPEFSASHIARLHKGREARNLIAHDGALIGGICVAEKHVIKAFVGLRTAVTNLVDADNLVSTWLYEIEAKQHAGEMVRNYPVWVDRWIFRPFDEFLRDYHPVERKESGSERVMRLMQEPRRYPDYVWP
jgi:hypothetical protein